MKKRCSSSDFVINKRILPKSKFSTRFSTIYQLDNFFSSKRSQITIFVIIAIMIIVIGVLAYLFLPKIQTGFGVSTNNPNVFIQNCMSKSLSETIEKISLQGGSLNPGNYILYQNEKVEYLCYTEEDYTQCVMQKPLLKNQIENEIKQNLVSGKTSCLESLKKNFEAQGYNVDIQPGDSNVEILPGRVEMNFQNVLTLRKDSSERYDDLGAVTNNNLYEMIGIAGSILNMEARYGDAETTVYMNYYHHLKVEKFKQDEGSTIYVISDRNTGEKFQFATRSIAFPAGI